jgi:hypothetical protein
MKEFYFNPLWFTCTYRVAMGGLSAVVIRLILVLYPLLPVSLMAIKENINN